MVAGYAVGGGHILHLVCDLTIAGDNAVFGQTGPRVGSFDGGFGSSLLARNVGVKKAKEIWFLSRLYDATEALEMGLVNTVVPLAELERETVAWCREMAALSPLSLRLLKASFNATEDGLAGIQQLSHDATLLFYMTEEGQEGRNAYQQGRSPDFSKFPEEALTLRIWLMAARPRTLPAAIAPVLVGTAAAIELVGELPRFGALIAALVGSIFIQIGTNLANDYSDAKRGADTVERLGPVRVTAAGLVAPQRVLVATWLAFAVAVAAGIYLATVAGWVIIAVGVASIAAGVLYTGGPRPYGYAGLGELFVFLFFGLVAVNGSYYVQLEELEWLPFGLSVAVGCLATAILVVNNVRDIETDRRAGKNTLAVRIGRANARRLYLGLVGLAYVTLAVILVVEGGPWWGLLGLISAPLAIRPTREVMTRTDGPALNAALAGTGALLGAFSLALSAGLLIAA